LKSELSLGKFISGRSEKKRKGPHRLQLGTLLEVAPALKRGNWECRENLAVSREKKNFLGIGEEKGDRPWQRGAKKEPVRRPRGRLLTAFDDDKGLKEKGWSNLKSRVPTSYRQKKGKERGIQGKIWPSWGKRKKVKRGRDSTWVFLRRNVIFCR